MNVKEKLIEACELLNTHWEPIIASDKNEYELRPIHYLKRVLTNRIARFKDEAYLQKACNSDYCGVWYAAGIFPPDECLKCQHFDKERYEKRLKEFNRG